MYSMPKLKEIQTTDLCDYGCNHIALFQFGNKKKCCSKHPNSCPGKRERFSKLDDHNLRAAKSLQTRLKTGATKTSRKKAVETCRANGAYDRMRKLNQERWANRPHNNNLRCPLKKYKNLSLIYQGTYELKFLETLEAIHGLDWIDENVKRGPSIWYLSPDGKERLYISDFIVGNTIYEIKSNWTWNRKGSNLLLEEINKSKLTKCVELGYNVILVINGKEIKWT